MIARQNDHRLGVIAQDLRSALQQANWLAVIIERVAGEQDNIGIDFCCRSQDFR
jgi:hypothetical protein